MSKADEIYKELVLDIYENGVWDKNEQVRTKYADGSPAYTKSIFGKQVVFEEGEIPLLTSKFVGWRTALKEMLLFWVHQTVKKEDFKSWNVRVWDEWFLDDNTLGKSYAYQFESRPHKEITKIKTIKKEKHLDILPHIKVSEMRKPILHPKLNSKYIGKVFKTKNHGEYIVLDSYYKEGYPNPRVLVQFLETGFTKETDIASVMRKQDIKDNYYRKYFNVGYIGNLDEIVNIGEKEKKALYRRWYYMLERCYKKDSNQYHNYGQKGVFVDESWHSLENYIRDIIHLPNYFIAKENEFMNYEIDKDYYNSNCYGKETCVWIEGGENLVYSNNPTPVIVTTPNGDKYTFLSVGDAEKTFNLTNLNKVVTGERANVRNYTASKIENDDASTVFRYKLSNNQVIDLINNIKKTPMSRRLMTSFWSDKDVSEKALQECAMQTTWNVRDGKLDLLLYSRSVDSMLGLPYNWIQYWFLLQMVSQATGLKAGRFIHQMGNVHYYDVHEKNMLEQLEPSVLEHEQPDFWINPDVSDFFQFTPEDIKIENYNHNGRFNYEVAI